jgi:CRP/FNR family transcriptional regulator
VRRQLLELAREHGRVRRDGIRIDLPLTHDLIADMVGCARETVTRAFDELQREGFVERCGPSYQLRVRPELLYV